MTPVATAASAVFLFLHYCLLTAYVVPGRPVAGRSPGRCRHIRSGARLRCLDRRTGGIAAAGDGGAPEHRADGRRRRLVLLHRRRWNLTRRYPSCLRRADWSAITPALPVIPVVYVYQTVVPTLCYRLQCDLGFRAAGSSSWD